MIIWGLHYHLMPSLHGVHWTKMILLVSTGFIVYTCAVVLVVAVLIFRYVPRCGQTHMVVYIGICSLMGSLTVCLLSFKVGRHYTFHATPFSSDVFPCWSVGHECQGSGDCFEAIIFWIEPIYLLPDMVLHSGCDSMLSSADQLFKHGKFSNFSCLRKKQWI